MRRLVVKYRDVFAIPFGALGLVSAQGKLGNAPPITDLSPCSFQTHGSVT
jgi:hypothetical protein